MNKNRFSQFGVRLDRDDPVLKEMEDFAYDVGLQLYQRFVRELGMSLPEVLYNFDCDLGMALINEGMKDSWNKEKEEIEKARMS